MNKLFYKKMFKVTKSLLFWNRRSTFSNLVEFSSFVLRNMSDSGQVDVIYTDFEKAFDRVNHNLYSSFKDSAVLNLLLNG